MEPVEVLWDGDWVPPERTWDEWKYYGMEMGYPPGENRLKTLPPVVLKGMLRLQLISICKFLYAYL